MTDAYGSAVTSVSYPIYDGHGNMVRTLSRSGSGYAVSTERIFGTWGEVRNSGGTSESKGKYCSNLGHVQDDESGLIYMRARYYEPGMGRFVSEDSGLQGSSWFVYCGNMPVERSDASGRSYQDVEQLLERAWQIFSSSGWGAGTADTRRRLLQIVSELKKASTAAQRAGESLMKEGAADEEVASCMGGASYMEQKIGEIKMGLGSMSMASGVAAQLGIGCVKIMLKLLAMQDGETPWDWFAR